MTVRLNNRAYDYAKALIQQGRFVYGARDAWSEHRPFVRQENEFIQQHGLAKYGKWYLGINDDPTAGLAGRAWRSQCAIGGCQFARTRETLV
jgi:hypothetical protein